MRSQPIRTIASSNPELERLIFGGRRPWFDERRRSARPVVARDSEARGCQLADQKEARMAAGNGVLRRMRARIRYPSTENTRRETGNRAFEARRFQALRNHASSRAASGADRRHHVKWRSEMT